MFAVIFEVQPRAEQWETYLGIAQGLRPALEQIDGFVDNVRYRSLTRPGWLLSLSGWRDEKAVVRWRTQAPHHHAQERGRGEVFRDYHLRVGEVTRDTRLPDGHVLRRQRLDATETGTATVVTLIDARREAGWLKAAGAEALARNLGLAPGGAGLVEWDVFEAVLTPGEAILLLAWRDETAAVAYEATAALPDDARLRRVGVVRDYGMFDRREAPQFYPEVTRGS